MALMNCPECGKEISDMAANCPNCGAPMLSQNALTHSQPNTSNQSPKKKGHGCLITLIFTALFAFSICFGVSQIIKDPEKYNKSNEIQIVFDSTIYADISVNELFDLIGNPEHSDEWSNETSKGSFLMATYGYNFDDMYVEFIVHDNTVVKVHCFSNDTWSVPSNDINTIFQMFNISPDDAIKVTVNTGSTYKFSPVSEKIDKLEIYNYDSNSKTFDTIYITYNLDYFEN